MVWLVAIVTDSVIIETTMGITITRKVPTTFSRDLILGPKDFQYLQTVNEAEI